MIAICIPIRGKVSLAWATAFAQCLKHTVRETEIFVSKHYRIDRSREDVVKAAIQSGATQILFWDSDILPYTYKNGNFFPFPDFINFMLKLDYPIVSGLYYSKRGHLAIYKYTSEERKPYEPINAKFEDLVNNVTFVDATALGLCLHPDTLIITSEGLVPISKINVGTRVLTHLGRWRKVTAISKRYYKGELVSILTYYSNTPVCLTPEHPILIAKKTKTIPRKHVLWYDSYRWSGKKERKYRWRAKPNSPYQLLWVRVGQIKKKDILALPVLREPEKQKEHIRDLTWKNLDITTYIDDFNLKNNKVFSIHGFGKNGEHIKINRFIPLNANFMKLSGFYVAEGYADDAGIHFSFHKKEVEFQNIVREAMKSCFGVENYYERIRGNSYEVSFCSKILGKFFGKLFGRNSHTKKIPNFFFYKCFPKELLIDFLWACFMGDGHVRREFIDYTTVSPKLATSLYLLLGQMGCTPTFKIEKAFHVKLAGYSKKIFSSKLKVGSQDYEPTLFGQRGGARSWNDSRYIFTTIRKIEKVPYEGYVYNLQVEEDESYCTPTFAVHNCLIDVRVFELIEEPWFEYRFDREKKLEISEDLWWCNKCREAGFPVMVLGQVCALHECSALIYPDGKLEYESLGGN